VELYICLDGMEPHRIEIGEGGAKGRGASWTGNYNCSSSFTPRTRFSYGEFDSLTKQNITYPECIVCHGIPHSKQQTINSSLCCYSNATQ